jgi:hypothetical protein
MTNIKTLTNTKVGFFGMVILLSALSLASRYALVFATNVQLTTTLVILTVLYLGKGKQSLLAGISIAVTSVFVMPIGVWCVFQAIGWSTVALLSYLFKNVLKSNIVVLSVFGFMVSLLFGAIMDFSSILVFGTFGMGVKAFLIGSIPFNLIHGANTVVTLPIVSKLFSIKK